MAKRLPTWNQSKYNCVNPDLSGVHAILKLEELEKVYRDLDNELVKLDSKPLNGSDLFTSVEDEILSIVQNRTKKEGRFVNLIETYRKSRSKFERHRDQAHRQIATQAAFSLLCQFMEFDHEKFRAMFQEHFGKELADNPSQTRKTQIKKTMKSNKTMQSQTWSDNNFGKFFLNGKHGVPSQWGSMNIAKYHKKRDIGKKIMREFIGDWRSRARLFSEAVTINGVLISSLPNEKRNAWNAAYNRAELGKLPKNPLYTARRSDIVDETAVQPMPAMINED